MNTILFQPTYSRALRLWHWTSFIVISLILFTVFVNKIFLNFIHIVPTIQESLTKAGANVSDGQTFRAAGALRDSVWVWHIKFGYALTALIFFRVLLEFFQPKKQKFGNKMSEAISCLRRKQQVRTATHYLLVKLIYLLFYILLATIVTTGLLLASQRSSPNVERFHSIKEIHEGCFNFLLLFILIHLFGVIRSERKTHNNMVSAMINGGEKL